MENNMKVIESMICQLPVLCIPIMKEYNNFKIVDNKMECDTTHEGKDNPKNSKYVFCLNKYYSDYQTICYRYSHIFSNHNLSNDVDYNKTVVLPVSDEIKRFQKEMFDLLGMDDLLFVIKGKSPIITSVGIYASGDYKTNGVISEHLPVHIRYNVNYRFGRALMVNGYVIYPGLYSNNLSPLNERINKRKLNELKIEKDTQPYH